MRVEITQEDIEVAKRAIAQRGTFLDKFLDPVARAIQRATGKQRVMVHPRACEVDGQFYTMSIEATEFGNRWAQGKEVEPISFTIEPKSINFQRKPKDDLLEK